MNVSDTETELFKVGPTKMNQSHEARTTGRRATVKDLLAAGKQMLWLKLFLIMAALVATTFALMGLTTMSRGGRHKENFGKI
jgi:hypothetical protein|tara:strand:+ start:2368 stop:2613 length:246 start_codon:yes stop_codon:yes gene_type:complete